MKKIYASLALIASLALLSSCSQNCDCDVYVDAYTYQALSGFQLTTSTLAVEDTCVDPGTLDSTLIGGGAYLTIVRGECP